MNSHFRLRSATALLALAVLSYGAPGVRAAQAAGAETQSADASLYASGTRAINESRWQDAINVFGQVAQAHGEHAEGALYWKAYAENKEDQPANALNTCAQLLHLYPKSRWLDECRALEIEIRRNSGNPVKPQNEPDANLKLLALNAVMQQEPDQAIPILQKLLQSDQPEELKRRALFVLAQNHTAQAQALMSQIAHGQSGPALQIKAIRMLAISGGKQSADMLADIYQHTSDQQVKKAILQSYVVSRDSTRLMNAAREESNPALVKTAVQSLGALGASPDLLTLYHSTTNAEAKRDIINALIASGRKGAEALSDIAGSEQDPDLRRRAIRNLGIAGGPAATPELVAVYQKNTDDETRKAAAQALFLAQDAHDLVALARAEKDPAMKQYLVQQLSIMHNQEATDYMLEILNK